MDNVLSSIKKASTLNELEDIRVKTIGKKGSLTIEFAALKELGEEDKKEKAKELNIAKARFNEAYEEKRALLEDSALKSRLKDEKVDVTLFNAISKSGSFHPINEISAKIIDYFISMNFAIETGPLAEEDFYNFEALNFPKFHPARDMQDTFFFNDGKLLRTHTSPVQIRTMLNQKPPIRMISPGAVFRRDYDLTHSPMFHQIEGLVVDEEGKVSFANLKYILEDFLRYMFGDVKIRFRSSFFPFTEPSAEVDISCIFCKGSGCRVCSHTGWLEVLGCGIVDDNVFKSVNLENVSGYAFGLGIERFAMLINRVPDLRSFFESDLRLLEQFV